MEILYLIAENTTTAGKHYTDWLGEHQPHLKTLCLRETTSESKKSNSNTNTQFTSGRSCHKQINQSLPSLPHIDQGMIERPQAQHEEPVGTSPKNHKAC